jgi:short-subunit dehydrogenase
MADKKAVIVTGASLGVGAAVTHAFLDRGYHVVATSRSIFRAGFAQSLDLALVDGDIGQAATAEKVATIAINTSGTIDRVVNNAGIFTTKLFTEYTAEAQRHAPRGGSQAKIYWTARERARCRGRTRCRLHCGLKRARRG